MEPKFEQPKQYTPEEIANLEKSRTISDAELLKGGAEYLIEESSDKKLIVAELNTKDIAWDHETKELRKHFLEEAREDTKRIQDILNKEEIKLGDNISVMCTYGHTRNNENEKEQEIFSGVYKGVETKGLFESFPQIQIVDASRKQRGLSDFYHIPLLDISEIRKEKRTEKREGFLKSLFK